MTPYAFHCSKCKFTHAGACPTAAAAPAQPASLPPPGSSTLEIYLKYVTEEELQRIYSAAKKELFNRWQTP